MSEGQEVVVLEQQVAPLTVFGTDDPGAIVDRVTSIATPLAAFIKRQHMSTNIQGREYVLAEGWSFMGAMLGVAPRTVSISELRDADGLLVGFEANVELLTRDGSVVGGAIAECSRAERNWGDRDDFALKSMSQTRATGKAYRMAFGFVMKAAGYEATPAEEMVVESEPGQRAPARGSREPRQPVARGETRYAWRDSLQRAMAEYGITGDDLEAFLGDRPSAERIQQWLDENPAKNVIVLVQECEAAKVANRDVAEVLTGEVVE